MKILVFGIHPDDIELGCGGTVAKCVRQGHEVSLVDLTRGERSSNGTPEERALEAQEAARLLGCAARGNLELPDAAIQSENPEHGRRVVSCIRQHRPDLVLFSSGDDPHPDHVAGGALIEHALYLSGIYGYDSGGGEERWAVRQALLYPGRREIEAAVVVDVTDTFAAKLEAIQAHRTQFQSHPGSRETPLNRPGFLELVEARALASGHRIGVRYGEPFETLKPLGLRDLSVFE